MSGQEYTIGTVRVRDLATVSRMSYTNMLGADQHFTRLLSRPISRWTTYIQLPLGLLFAGRGFKVMSNGQIIGCAFLHLKKRSGYVFNVNVNAQHRRQGVGRRLMRHLETVAQANLRTWMALQVDEGNLPARNLYEQLGYRAYHPQFFRREDKLPIRAVTLANLALERQKRYKGRQLYDRYLCLEQRAGDGWAYPVLGEYDIDPPGGGSYWRCLLQGDEIGCAWCTGKIDWPLIRIALKPEFWGENIIGELMNLLVTEALDNLSGVDLYLGSSAHHEAALPLLDSLGYENCRQPRFLMLKSLRDEQGARHGEETNQVSE